MVRAFMNGQLITKEEQEKYEIVMTSIKKAIGFRKKGKEGEENKSKDLQCNAS